MRLHFPVALLLLYRATQKKRICDAQSVSAKEPALATGLNNIHGDTALTLELGAIKFIRSNLVEFLLSQWNVDKQLLLQLSLPILARLSPISPISLIGCPGESVPYNLTACTHGIISEDSILGQCPRAGATYSHLLRSCATKAEADPYTTCPRGYRVTLPPVDIVKGPCHNEEIIPPIPTCDAPYKLLEDLGICLKTWATTGYIGCRPGEIRQGRRCFSAIQLPLQIECPDGFTSHLQANGIPQCLRSNIIQGDWNVWTQRPICPKNYKADIERFILKNDTENPRVFNPNSVRRTPNITCYEKVYVAPQVVKCPENSIPYAAHLSENKNSPPAQIMRPFRDTLGTCVKINEFPIGPACSEVDQKIFIKGAKVIVEEAIKIRKEHLLNSSLNSSVFPDSTIDDTLHEDNEAFAANKEDNAQCEYDKDSSKKEKLHLLRRLYHNSDALLVEEVSSMLDLSNTSLSRIVSQILHASTKRRLGRLRYVKSEGTPRKFSRNNQGETEEAKFFKKRRQIHDIYSTSRNDAPRQKSSENGKSDLLLSDDVGNTANLVYSTSSNSSASHDFPFLPANNTEISMSSEAHAVHQSQQSKKDSKDENDFQPIKPVLNDLRPGTELPDVDFSKLVDLEKFGQELKKRLSVSLDEIDWLKLFVNGDVEVICESSSVAQFYLACPEKFKMRKDGSCRGTDYTNFVVLCPDGFALDQVALSETKYKKPNVVCVGAVPTATNYFCPDDSEPSHLTWNDLNSEIVESNSNSSQTPKTEQFRKDVKLFPFLEDDEVERSLMLNILTRSFAAKAATSGTVEALRDDGIPAVIASLADLLDQFDVFHVNQKRHTYWQLLKDYPQLPELLVERSKVTKKYIQDFHFQGQPHKENKNYLADSENQWLNQLKESTSVLTHRNSDPLLSRSGPHQKKLGPATENPNATTSLDIHYLNAILDSFPFVSIIETLQQQRNATFSTSAITEYKYEPGLQTDQSFKHSVVSADGETPQRITTPLKINELPGPVAPNPSPTSKEIYSAKAKVIVQRVKDEFIKLCYDVDIVPTWFSPTPELILGLYGQTFGGQFLATIEQAAKAGGSPFYQLLPKPKNFTVERDKATLDSEKMQTMAQLGPRAFTKHRQTGVPLPTT